ncbi:MAG: aminotransferase class I/II-fold pyridoxal phosphate-dependent enzyme [Thermodesulfobacteriota bacterium]
MYIFPRIDRLPPYVFASVDELKMEARKKGEDIIDLGMGNPDLPTPKHIVNKMVEAVQKPKNHRYSASRGITKLRYAISDWYRVHFGVEIDPEEEAVVTIGAKEGIAHLVLATICPGDVVFAPNPTYPIHPYSAIIAGGDLRGIPIGPDRDFFEDLLTATKQTWPRPKMLIISYPHNPTTNVADREFFEKIVEFCTDHEIMVIHDFAYADLVFDGYRPPSFLEIPGAKEIGVEFYSLTKSFSMPGWRVGFCIGNNKMIAALRKIKSYLDYGIFQPIQISSIIALKGSYDCVREMTKVYQQRRNTLINGLARIGWKIEKPKGTMFVWGKIPDSFIEMGSLEFSKLLIQEAKVAVSPGIGFGQYGEGYIRFALVENNHRINQAIRGIKKIL